MPCALSTRSLGKADALYSMRSRSRHAAISDAYNLEMNSPYLQTNKTPLTAFSVLCAGLPPSWACRKGSHESLEQKLAGLNHNDVGLFRRKFLWHSAESRRPPWYGSFSKTRSVTAWHYVHNAAFGGCCQPVLRMAMCTACVSISLLVQKAWLLGHEACRWWQDADVIFLQKALFVTSLMLL